MGGGWDGDRYAAEAAPQRDVGRAFVAALPLEGVTRVLDVGCGDGAVTELLAQRAPGAQVVGVDPSTSMVDRASCRARPGLVFRVGNVLTLDEEPSDLVVSLNALHWVADTETAVLRLAAATSPGGTLVIQLVPSGPGLSIERAAMEVTGTAHWSVFFEEFPPPFVHRAPEAYAECLRASGLRVASSRSTLLDWTFPDRAAFARWCGAGMTAWTDRLPVERREPFLAEVVKRYAGLGSGPVLFRFRQLRLVAHRSP